MLPARSRRSTRLAEVLPNCLAALQGSPGALGFPPVRHVTVVLIDGLGAAALRARSGHARTLAPLLTKSSIINAGFPTTTASSIATFATGADPGQTGMVGYSVLDAAHDRVVNQLSGWDQLIDPAVWQRRPTMFEAAREAGIRSVAIGTARYRDSGFTRAVLRGSEYLSAATMTDRVSAARSVMRDGGSSLTYLYVPELDAVAHKHGVESAEWTAALETADAGVGTLVDGLRADEAVVVTADHGVIDVPVSAQVIVPPELLMHVRHVAGEPRCLQLYFEPGADAAGVQADFEREFGAQAWVASRADAVESGVFGEVDAEVLPRIGDLLVAARSRVAFYTKADDPGRRMIGQHGSLSPEETQVPLLRFGAFAR